ncbi:hypothetical protein ACTFIW_008721 [Dictyostelium discoideum]
MEYIAVLFVFIAGMSGVWAHFMHSAEQEMKRKIIIDAKVPLEAYLKAIEAESPEICEKEMDRHVEQLEYVDTLLRSAGFADDLESVKAASQDLNEYELHHEMLFEDGLPDKPPGLTFKKGYMVSLYTKER